MQQKMSVSNFFCGEKNLSVMKILFPVPFYKTKQIKKAAAFEMQQPSFFVSV